MHESLTPLTHPPRAGLSVDQSAHFGAALDILIGHGVAGAATIAEQPHIDPGVARQLRGLLALDPAQRAAIAAKATRLPGRELGAALRARRCAILDEFESRGALLPGRRR